MHAPDFWDRQDVSARFAATALAPLGWVYGGVTKWKSQRSRPYRSRAKVICVGNLTVGGSGKTPVAVALVRILQGLGFRPTVLARGYGGRFPGPAFVDANLHTAADVGDEPLLLARTAPVVVSRDRRAGATLADTNGADAIVMDDGHQNFSLAKDLSIVVVDSEYGFGNGCVLPAGPLREPPAEGLARADAVVLVGDGSPALPAFSGPVVRARLVPCDEADWKGQKVIAFAGIGRPEKFFATLRSLGAVLADAIGFADHHVYGASEIAHLKERAERKNAMLITTEKDFVRLSSPEREGIHVLRVQAEFESPETLMNLIAKTCRR